MRRGTRRRKGELLFTGICNTEIIFNTFVAFFFGTEEEQIAVFQRRPAIAKFRFDALARAVHAFGKELKGMDAVAVVVRIGYKDGRIEFGFTTRAGRQLARGAPTAFRLVNLDKVEFVIIRKLNGFGVPVGGVIVANGDVVGKHLYVLIVAVKREVLQITANIRIACA